LDVLKIHLFWSITVGKESLGFCNQ